jgi:cell fate regulator YaaT (PSP1 superfamily)
MKNWIKDLKKYNYHRQDNIKCCANCNNLKRLDGSFGWVVECNYPKLKRLVQVSEIGICDNWEHVTNMFGDPLDI